MKNIEIIETIVVGVFFCFIFLVLGACRMQFSWLQQGGPLPEAHSSDWAPGILGMASGSRHVPDISDKTPRSVLSQWLLLLSLGRRISGSHQASGGRRGPSRCFSSWLRGASLALSEQKYKTISMEAERTRSSRGGCAPALMCAAHVFLPVLTLILLTGPGLVPV